MIPTAWALLARPRSGLHAELALRRLSDRLRERRGTAYGA